jgi:hypothetical protein
MATIALFLILSRIPFGSSFPRRGCPRDMKINNKNKHLQMCAKTPIDTRENSTRWRLTILSLSCCSTRWSQQSGLHLLSLVCNSWQPSLVVFIRSDVSNNLCLYSQSNHVSTIYTHVPLVILTPDKCQFCADYITQKTFSHNLCGSEKLVLCISLAAFSFYFSGLRCWHEPRVFYS